MTIIQAIRDFFLKCPLMTGNAVNVDYLPESAKNGVEFSIDAVPGTEVIRQYIDGGAECQYLFVLRSVNNYGADDLQNLTNSGFFDGLTDWLRQMNRNRQLPELNAGMTATKIEPVSTAYLFAEGADTGKYQIQCRLLYDREGER